MPDYPGAAKAVELCENLTAWEMYCRTAHVEGVLSLKERMRASLIEATSRCDAERATVLFEALAEWDHRDFLAYLVDKIAAESAQSGTPWG